MFQCEEGWQVSFYRPVVECLADTHGTPVEKCCTTAFIADSL